MIHFVASRAINPLRSAATLSLVETGMNHEGAESILADMARVQNLPIIASKTKVSTTMLITFIHCQLLSKHSLQTPSSSA